MNKREGSNNRKMNLLDDLDRIHAVDSKDMYRAIFHFPAQLRQALTIGKEIDFNRSLYDGISNIVLCGMGGSAIGGDLARSLLSDSLLYPMQVCRNYSLPAYIGSDTLVIGASYSGNTEETLSAIEQALSRNCRLFALATGGKLLALARKHGFPTAQLPGGLKPRAALGYLFVPLILFFARLGLSQYGTDHILALADFLQDHGNSLKVETPISDNPAKSLAKRLYGSLPIIYSGPEITDAVGTRIKGQISENAKMLAFANQFPEFNHNELVGWKKIATYKDCLRVVFLRDREDNHRVTARIDIVKKMIKKEKVEIIELVSEGNDRLQRTFSLIQFGDYLSFYLAILNNVDPTPAAPIDYLKVELTKIT